MVMIVWPVITGMVVAVVLLPALMVVGGEQFVAVGVLVGMPVFMFVVAFYG